ncbi:hypothetical protein C8R48DRAFT_676715 [Suillus tomentosus]|nr:hypothetical protein C8R48DRAFT_676715 [Suillus tomentosus]
MALVLRTDSRKVDTVETPAFITDCHNGTQERLICKIPDCEDQRIGLSLHIDRHVETELHFKYWQGSFLGHQIRDFQAEPVFLSALAPGPENRDGGPCSRTTTSGRNSHAEKAGKVEPESSQYNLAPPEITYAHMFSILATTKYKPNTPTNQAPQAKTCCSYLPTASHPNTPT